MGYLRHVPFTLSKCPEYDDADAVAGVLVTVFETTNRLAAGGTHTASETRYLAR